MAWPTKNEYWKLRTVHGRSTEFKPDELLEGANEYFKFCIENPLMESVVHGKDSNIVELPKMRAFTISGLCNFLDIVHSTWKNYEKISQFLHITTYVHDKIRNQKLEGAIVGIFNSNIIARDLGLSDHQEHTVISEQPLYPPLDGTPSDSSDSEAKKTN